MFISCSSAAQGDTLHTHLWHEQNGERMCACVCVRETQQTKRKRSEQDGKASQLTSARGCAPRVIYRPAASTVLLSCVLILWHSGINILFHASSNKTRQLGVNSRPKIHTPTQADSPEDRCVNAVSLPQTHTHTTAGTHTHNSKNHWPQSRQAYRHTAFLFSPSCSSRPYCIIL